ncbi:MAG TPA: hypothetical protein DC049_06760 [Spirochaetia bacterium]|nr:hypothetical protein [Spirochaetia bacterium]
MKMPGRPEKKNITNIFNRRFINFLLRSSVAILESDASRTEKIIKKLLLQAGALCKTGSLSLFSLQEGSGKISILASSSARAGRIKQEYSTSSVSAACRYLRNGLPALFFPPLKNNQVLHYFRLNPHAVSSLGVPVMQGKKPAAFLLAEFYIKSWDTQAPGISFYSSLAKILFAACKKKKEHQNLERERFLVDTIMKHQLDRVYIKDSRARFIKVNKALLDYHHLKSPEESTGKTDYDLFTREHADQAWQEDKKIIKTGKPCINLVEKETLPGGETRWSSTTKVPLRSKSGKIIGLFGMSRDITELVHTREIIETERNLLRTMIDNIPDCIYVKDRESRYLLNNRAHLELLGCSRQKEVCGKNDFAFFPHAYAGEFFSGEQKILKSGRPSLNHVSLVLNKEKKQIYMLTSKIPLYDKDKKISGIIGISRNITDQINTENELKKSYEKLKKNINSIIYTMAHIVEVRDPYTAGHQQRVAELSMAIAKKMNLEQEKIYYIQLAAAVHDIGKIHIPAEILSRPGDISDIEYSLIKSHTELGYEILANIDFGYPIARIVLQHHEKMNGSGYPHGLKGESIMTEARIIAVADVVEAMANHRPYRPSLGLKLALREIKDNSGTLFDPAVVNACLMLFRKDHFNFS